MTHKKRRGGGSSCQTKKKKRGGRKICAKKKEKKKKKKKEKRKKKEKPGGEKSQKEKRKGCFFKGRGGGFKSHTKKGGKTLHKRENVQILIPFDLRRGEGGRGGALKKGQEFLPLLSYVGSNLKCWKGIKRKPLQSSIKENLK